MKRSKEYINGFKHGLNWAIMRLKCELKARDIRIDEGSIGEDICIDDIIDDGKEAIKSLKAGR